MVGTQAAIAQEATEAFSRTFYQQLAAGKTVDIAMAEARLALGRAHNGGGWSQRDWGLYILSMFTPPEELPILMYAGHSTWKPIVPLKVRQADSGLRSHSSRWSCWSAKRWHSGSTEQELYPRNRFESSRPRSRGPFRLPTLRASSIAI